MTISNQIIWSIENSILQFYRKWHCWNQSCTVKKFNKQNNDLNTDENKKKKKIKTNHLSEKEEEEEEEEEESRYRSIINGRKWLLGERKRDVWRGRGGWGEGSLERILQFCASIFFFLSPLRGKANSAEKVISLVIGSGWKGRGREGGRKGEGIRVESALNQFLNESWTCLNLR